MKKTLMLLAVLQIVTLSLFANNTITKKYDFGSIKGIEAGSIYEIEVTEGNQRGVTIVCDEAYEEHLDVKYFQGELILSMKPNVKMIKNKHGIKVTLQMSTIEDIDLSGAAKLTVSGTFKTRELEIDLSGASSVKGLQINGNELSIDCSGASNIDITGNFSNSIDVEASGASNITITGNCRDLDIEASGASNVQVTGEHKYTEASCSGASAIKLEGSTNYIKSEVSGASSLKAQYYTAKDGYAEVNGASNAKIRCTGDLKIMVSKMSKLTYYGNPNIINIDRDSNIRKGDD